MAFARGLTKTPCSGSARGRQLQMPVALQRAGRQAHRIMDQASRNRFRHRRVPGVRGRAAARDFNEAVDASASGARICC